MSNYDREPEVGDLEPHITRRALDAQILSQLRKLDTLPFHLHEVRLILGYVKDPTVKKVMDYINEATTPEERRKRKAECFGLMYGAGPVAMKKVLEKPQRDGAVKTFLQKWSEVIKQL